MKRIVFGMMLGLAPIGACAREAPTVGTTTTTGALVVPNTAAIDEVTRARCSREVACNNVGVGPYYSGYDECVGEVGRNTQAALADACPNGVADKRLSTCLDDIGNQACMNRIDTLDRITSCRSAKLCL